MYLKKYQLNDILNSSCAYFKLTSNLDFALVSKLSFESHTNLESGQYKSLVWNNWFTFLSFNVLHFIEVASI